MPDPIRWDDKPSDGVTWDDEVRWDAPDSVSSKARQHLAGTMGADQGDFLKGQSFGQRVLRRLGEAVEPVVEFVKNPPVEPFGAAQAPFQIAQAPFSAALAPVGAATEAGVRAAGLSEEEARAAAPIGETVAQFAAPAALGAVGRLMRGPKSARPVEMPKVAEIPKEAPAAPVEKPGQINEAGEWEPSGVTQEDREIWARQAEEEKKLMEPTLRQREQPERRLAERRMRQEPIEFEDRRVAERRQVPPEVGQAARKAAAETLEPYTGQFDTESEPEPGPSKSEIRQAENQTAREAGLRFKSKKALAEKGARGLTGWWARKVHEAVEEAGSEEGRQAAGVDRALSDLNFAQRLEQIQRDARTLSPVPDVGLGLEPPTSGLPSYKSEFAVRNYFGRQGMHQLERDFPESAKALQRAAESPNYARMAGRADVKDISRAMGDPKGTEFGWRKFSTPMVDRQLQDMQQRYIAAGKLDKAAQVKRLMTDDALAQAMSTPEFKAAKAIYDQGIGAVARDAHVANGGVRIATLGDDYYPLVSEEIGAGPSGSKIPLQKPRAPGSQHRTGLSEAYDVSSDALVGNLKRGPAAQYGRYPAALRANNMGRAIDTMQAEGLIRPLAQGERAPETMELTVGGKKYEAAVTVQPTRRGNYLVPEALWPEIKPVFENLQAPQPTKLGTLVSAPTQAAVLGVAEPLGHGLVNIPLAFGKAKMIDFGLGPGNRVLNLPGVKQVAGFVKAIVDNPMSAENKALLKEAHEQGIFAPRTPFHNSPGAKFIARMDTNARLILYKSAKEFEPDAAPTRLREVVRQLGEYSAQLGSGSERAVKTGPFSRIAGSLGPFITAGKAGGLNAAEQYGQLLGLGTRPIGSADLVGNWQASANRGIVAATAMWVGAYKAIRGKFPWDEGEGKTLQLFKVAVPDSWRRTEVGKSLWGTKKGTAYIDFGGVAGAARGARYTGLRGLSNTLLRGGNIGQAGEAAAVDIINAQIAPYAGPPVRAAGRALNLEPQLTGLRDRQGRIRPEFWTYSKEKAEPGWPTVSLAGKRVFGALNPTEELALEGAKRAPGSGLLRDIVETVRLPVSVSGPTNVKAQEYMLRQQRIQSKRPVRPERKAY